MKVFYTLLIILIPFIGFGQGWEQTFGGTSADYGNSIIQIDGGYILNGNTASDVLDGSVYLIKINDNGNEIWTKTFGFTDDESISSVRQTSDGGYIIAVDTNYSFGVDISLIKTDADGNELWRKKFGGTEEDYCRSVQQTNDGGYIISGSTSSFGSGERDFYLIKTDVIGNELWSKTYGGVNDDDSFSVQQTNDGGYIMTGASYSFGNGSCDVYLVKTDASGIEQWSQTFGGVYDDVGYSVQQTNDGGYIITGLTDLDGNAGYVVYLIKTDGNGNELWSKLFVGNIEAIGTSVQQTNDDGFIITGTTGSYVNYDYDIYLIKTDASGIEEWSQTFGGTKNEMSGYGNSVQQTNDGGYILIGTTLSFGNGYEDIYVIKTDGNGNITSTFEIPRPNPERKLEKTINLKGQEIKPHTNQPIIEIFNDGSVEKVLIIE